MADDLFSLIKSLDKNEKGYFKKFAARYGEKSTGNDYLKLFDLLDKADDYNEDALKKYFAKTGKKFNLSSQKGYLYNQIIRCLRIYNTGKSTEYQLNEMLLDIHNLMDKGLDEQAMELLNEGMQKAEEGEHLTLLLQFVRTKESLMIRHLQQYPPAEILKMKATLASISDKIKESQLLDEKMYHMKLVFDEVIKTGSLTPELKAKADELIKHPVLTAGLTGRDKAKAKVYTTYYLHSCILSNDNDALKYLKLTNETFRDSELDARTTAQYLANISNIILIALNLQLVKEAEQQLHTLETIRFKDPSLELYRRRLFSKNQLMYLTVLSQHRKLTQEEINKAEQTLLACENPLVGNNNLMSCFYLSILFYVVGDRDKMLHWLDKANAHENVSFTTVQAFARLLSALMHYEQDNLSLMESALNNAQYFMKKNEINSPFLKQVASWFTKLQTGLQFGKPRGYLF